MQYLVCAENTNYYYWQLSLLIESFRKHNCEKDLQIIIFEKPDKPIDSFYKIIDEFPNVTRLKNVGGKIGYSKINRLFGMYWALKEKIIQQPFAFIPTDCVLHKPLNWLFEECAEVVFLPDEEFSLSYVQKQIKNSENIFLPPEPWINVNSIFLFNNLPLDFFDVTTIFAEELAFKQMIHNHSIFEETDKLALSLSIGDLIGKAKIRGEYSLAKNMLEFSDASFIHYKHGMPPVFIKQMFRYEYPNYASIGDPYEALLENPSTPSAHYMAELARSVLK